MKYIIDYINLFIEHLSSLFTDDTKHWSQLPPPCIIL